MTGVEAATRASARPGRIGLLLGLVLLVTAHLAGAVHMSSFAGPHVAVEVTTCSQPEADDGHGLGPAPGHHHHADAHIDHTVDRPRTAADDGIAGPCVGGPGEGLPSAADTAPAPADQERPGAAAGTADGHGTLALHCVWRL
ncbi:hypothetical protein [Streptomyces flaveolus]|uniref:hypothetical protein n=1 Tax=Streptomyces flaveolus TaxID=67297 RepID=UPI0036F4CFB2